MLTKKPVVRLIIAVCLLSGAALLSVAASIAVGHAPSALAAKPPKEPTATPLPTEPPPPTAVPCSDCPEIHVLIMHVGAWSNDSSNPGTQAVCRIFIEDASGNLIDGATVDIAWSGAVSATGSAVTQPHPELGQDTPSAVIYSPIGPKCKGTKPLVYTCTVTNVSAEGYTYVPGNNNETVDQADACN